MTLQKFIRYTPLDINGKQVDSIHELKLNVLERSGNYLLHKDLLRHFSSQKQSNTQELINGLHSFGILAIK